MALRPRLSPGLPLSLVRLSIRIPRRHTGVKRSTVATARHLRSTDTRALGARPLDRGCSHTARFLAIPRPGGSAIV